MNRSNVFKACVVAGLMLGTGRSYAQLKGDHFLGDAGLQSGTQPPPSISVIVPVYWYTASDFRNSSGNSAKVSPDIDMFVTGAGGSVVTPWKILGANYGATVLFAFASNKLDGNLVYSKSSLALSDTYVQPVQLGWHFKQVDVTAGYALYLPTGKYELGGDDNSGLGQWCNEFSAGATVFFDKKKTISFASLLSYGLYSKKKDTNLKTGDQLSIEGGLGKTFYHPVKAYPIPMIFNVGIDYYMQFKTTNDQIPVTDNLIFYGSGDHIYSLGLEGSVLFPKMHTEINFKWLREFSAVNRYEGNTFFLTLVPYLKFLQGKKH